MTQEKLTSQEKKTIRYAFAIYEASLNNMLGDASTQKEIDKFNELEKKIWRILK